MDSLDSALASLKPTLRTITSSLPQPIDNFALSLLGPQCHASLLQRLDFSSRNSACMQLAISKALGTAIITAASIVKVPQLIKLAQSQSAAGLSFTSYLLETASFTITLAYSVRNNFPFSTFGETAFIAIQDVAIGALILLYSGRSAGAAAFIAVIAAAGYALFLPEVVDMGSLKYLQAGAGILGIASKIPQIWTVYQEGGTGQLSAFAVCVDVEFFSRSILRSRTDIIGHKVFNYLAGSLSRIFTTLQEVDDPLILYGFIAGFILNAVLAGQMVYYWNSPSSTTKQTSKARPDATHQKEKLAIGSSSGSDVAGTPPSASRTKGPSTRRRG